jgi:hypothetical protein
MFDSVARYFVQCEIRGTVLRMIIGILSDTHGRADTAVDAVRVLLGHGAEYLVHCGLDSCVRRTARLLAKDPFEKDAPFCRDE